MMFSCKCLQVTPIEHYFYGIYKCVAKNVYGEVFHTISLQEARAPSEILQATQKVITGIKHTHIC